MFSKKTFFPRFLIVLIVLLSIFTRFYKLNWGSGYYFHPDENNIAMLANSLQLPIKGLGFFTKGAFSYGNFVSNLAFFVNLAREKFFPSTSGIDNFLFFILFLRFLSAVSSTLTVFFVYKICHKFWSYRIALISSFLVTLSPGLIQAAHFGTFESDLTLLSVISLYLCLKISQTPTKRNLFLSTFVVAIATALKINFCLILSIIYFAYFFNKNNKNSLHIKIFSVFLSGVFFLSIVFVLSPYYLTSSFFSMFNYEQQVVRGSMVVFYTRQFINSIPIIFTFLKVFPWQTNPLIILIFPFILLFSLFKPLKNKIILILFLLVLFLPNAFLFTKWSRYMIPVIPFIIIFCVAFIETHFKRSKNILATILVFTTLCLACKFTTLYLHPDIRIQASDWMFQNIPAEAKILSESGNVVDLPVFSHQFEVNNFDFYNIDSDINLANTLPFILKNSDYIIVPSRRVFKNQNNSQFPISSNYYRNLFSNNLGFTEIKEFKPQTDIFLNSEDGEETLTVFDRPTIRIFRKVQNLTTKQYEDLLW